MEKLFRELTNLLQMAADTRGVRTSYGVSVRIGGMGAGTTIAEAPPNSRAPAIDVFDEDDHIRVVAELPGVDERNVQWHVPDERHLVIQATAPDCVFERDLALASAVDAGRAVSCFENGILEIKLWKLSRR